MTPRQQFEHELLSRPVHCEHCNRDVTPDLQYYARHHSYDLTCPECMSVIGEVEAPELDSERPELVRY